MHEARLLRMYIPKVLDGLEIDPITSMIVVGEIARADAAAAWNLMLGATYGLWAAFLAARCAGASAPDRGQDGSGPCGPEQEMNSN
jgi:alkylation response protein AidB-like acyl-CoA dehydrogenase